MFPTWDQKFTQIRSNHVRNVTHITENLDLILIIYANEHTF